MRKLVATVALATLLSSSAHAQYGAWRGNYRAHAQVPPYRAYAQVPRYSPYYGAYAQSPYYGAYAQSPYFRTPGFYDLYGNPSPYPYSVYSTRGRYLGADPDPRVRSQLQHDPSQGLE
jgi:hypothetical protein